MDDEKVRRLALIGFPNNMTIPERDRWLAIAALEELGDSRAKVLAGGDRQLLSTIDAELERREGRRRHQETIYESRVSRRLDKWALAVAVFAAVLSAVSIAIAVVALRHSPTSTLPARLLPASVSEAPADHVVPTTGNTPKE